VKSEPKKMTCEEFYEWLENDYFFDSVYDEMYHSQHFSAKACFDVMADQAKAMNVELTDADIWEYEDFIWEAYQAAEKGLS